MNQNKTLISNSLNVKEVLEFAEMASVAYHRPVSINKKYGDKYRIVVKNPPNTQCQCVLFFDDKQQVQYISNRGSFNLVNFIKDGEYIKSFDDKTGIFLHMGFQESAIETYNCILPELNRNYSTFITGHSLGGAISVILHLYLLADGFYIKQNVTFGQPKFTNHDGVTKYRNIPLLRIIFNNDLVPLVPPLTYISSLFGAYCHLGEEIILLDDYYYCHFDKLSAENPDISDFWQNSLKGETSILDHFINFYTSNLCYKLNGCIEVPYSKREEYFEISSEKNAFKLIDTLKFINTL